MCCVEKGHEVFAKIRVWRVWLECFVILIPASKVEITSDQNISVFLLLEIFHDVYKIWDGCSFTDFWFLRAS